jgi:predicted transcriptional regulator
MSKNLFIPLINPKKVSNKNNVNLLFKQLCSFEEKATKQERIMFFILKEIHNNQTVFLKSIMHRLSWKKPCSTQEAQNIIKCLEKHGLISIIKECPTCSTAFNYLPNYCKNCGYKIIKQIISFKDKRLRPRYAIEITEKGREFVNELITSYYNIYSFFNTWSNSINHKLTKSFQGAPNYSNAIKQEVN